MRHLRNLTTVSGCIAALVPITLPGADASSLARPFPQHVKYAEGSLRPSHHEQAQLDDDVRRYYATWKVAYVREAGRDKKGATMYRVTFGKHGQERTVSEGQGYGMVVVALMAGHDPRAREIFDGMHEFALAHPSGKESRLMNWEVPAKSGRDSAFDGDADIAYALLLAHAQWGSGKADYAEAARQRLAGMQSATIGPRTKLPLLGDWVEADGTKYNESTPRSSDLMPGHFRAFARFTGDKTWDEVAAACERVVAALQSGPAVKTGLLPDFIVAADTAPRPAPPRFLEGKNDGAFSYNAGRNPWRLGADALLNPGVVSGMQAARISAWVRSATGGDPHRLRAGYALGGAPLKGSAYFTSFFAAPLGVAAMVDPGGQGWLDALYESIRTTHEDYFEDSVTLQCLLIMTGNFWQP